MTTVGKILVFLNLIFSFVVGSFAVMDYIARTHWADRYAKLSKSYAVLDATNQTYQGEIKRLADEKKALNEALASAGKVQLQMKDKDDPATAARKAVQLLEERGKMITRLEADLATKSKNLEDANRELSQYKTTTTTSQEDVKRRQEDVAKLRDELKAETERNFQLVKGTNEMRDRAVAAEIQSRSLRDINGRLEEQLQGLARDLARVKSSGGRTGGSTAGLNPPPEQVEGLIRRVDGRYVTLTIGSDAGLLKGHTMDVFGLGSNAGYRGKIKLVEVTANQAVGEVMGKLTTPIRVGDTVASSIMGSKR